MTADGILVVSRDGSRVVRVGRAGVRGLAWSHGGRSLVYDRAVGAARAGEPCVPSDLFVVSAAGGTPRRLTRDHACIGGISARP